MGDYKPLNNVDVPITIVGAGPVGMLLALQLDRLGIPHLLAERNLHTTKWPKMDLTSTRSMEILRVLGLADEYRALVGSVDLDANFDSVFFTRVLGEGRKVLGEWERPSVKVQTAQIRQNNDGSQPAEAGQRCTQIVFEAWMKTIVLTRTSCVESRFGWTYVGHEDTSDGIATTFVDQAGVNHVIRSKYLVACDGGGSRVRKAAGIKIIGGPMPFRLHLVHFKSQELARELDGRRFWHGFPIHGGFLIDQDGRDTFTVHFTVDQLPPGPVDPYELVYRALGGVGQKHEVKIDEVLVHSEWNPNFGVAECYHSESLKVFLAGDAAHRNPPHGGYGMNSGVADAFDLGWRLAALLKGYGGDLLLRSYDLERRPMMIKALERSHRHAMEHVKLHAMLPADRTVVEQDTPEAEALRRQIRDFLTASGPDTIDRGIEFDLRYHSPVIYQDGSSEREWAPRRYVPSTRPGSRVPHVFLRDGTTSTYDLFGREWTLIHFVDGDDDSSTSEVFSTAADKLAFPLKRVILRNEPHARRIWERPLVLVRPDTHVAWRGTEEDLARQDVMEILGVVSGNVPFSGYQPVSGAYVEDFKKLVAPFWSGDENANSQASIAGENF